MIAKDLINFMIPPLKVSDEVSKAKQWMEELRLSELPVTKHGKFVGMLSEECLYDEGIKGKCIEDFPLITESKIEANQHYYKVLKKAYSIGVRLVAVLDEEDVYLGVVSTEDIVEAFANSSSVNTPGAILVLSMEFRDYSLSEISRIIEMDDAKILSSHIVSDSVELGKIKVTLKINKEEITHIITTLEYHGYKVSESFSETYHSQQDQDRYDTLMKYLKI